MASGLRVVTPVPVVALIKVVVLLSEALLAVEAATEPSGVLVDDAPARKPEAVPAPRTIRAAPLPTEEVPTVLLVNEAAAPVALPPTGPLKKPALANEPAVALALAPPAAAPLPVDCDKLDTRPVVVAEPATPAAPVDPSGPVVAPPAAVPVADAVAKAFWLLSAVPFPTLVAPEMVAVVALFPVATCAMELVAVATPAASKTAIAIMLFFMMFP